MKIFMLDNYDSFTYNLVQYFQILGCDVTARRCDCTTVDAVFALRPDAIVLSPGPGRPESAGILLELIREKGLTIEAILLTHGHFDHIGAVNELQAVLQIPVYMGEKGMLYAENPVWNLSSRTEAPIVLKDVTYLADHAVIALKEKPSFQLELLDLPGHTADGVIYYTKEDGAAFVGDSIFQGSYGRTDMYGGDEEALLRGIRERILTLPDDTLLLSGHSAPTTPAEERGRSWYQP